MFRSAIVAFSVLTLLGGCATLGALGQATELQDAYQLKAPENLPRARGAPRAQDIIIEIPSASGAVDTDRILIRPQPTQVQYLPEARWIEAVPLMVQSALVEGLEKTGGFRFVGRKPLGSSGDVAVVSNLVDFDAVLIRDTEEVTVNIRLVVRLIREDDAEVIASKTFSATETAPDTSTSALVDAYNRASSRVFGGIVSWILAQRGIGFDGGQAT